MNVLLTGGTGFLGAALVGTLRQQGHEVTVLSRRPRGPEEVLWTPGSDDAQLAARIDGVDAVVNLAGESIAAGRWTAQRKQAIRQSRVGVTAALAEAISQAPRPPKVFLSGSATGYYGVRDASPLDERSAAGSDFLASVSIDWERAAAPATDRTRVVLLRTGVVLERDGGALPQMARPFWWGVGGPLGSGHQYLSWIHLQDWIALVLWALQRDSVHGPLNLTAPNPVTNTEFTQALAQRLRRPAVMRVPGFALRLLLGEMADALLLGGQRVLPRRAETEGFKFRYAHIGPALQAIYK